MEKFEVYYYDGIYYDLEELKSKGIVYEINSLLQTISHLDYPVQYYSEEGDLSSLNAEELTQVLEHQQNLPQDSQFIYVVDCKAKIIICMKKNYGLNIRYQSVLFQTEQERDELFVKIELEMVSLIEKYMNNSSFFKDDTKEYLKQMGIKRKLKEFGELGTNPQITEEKN